MSKLQQAKKGGFFLFLNISIVRLLGWKKGDEIMSKIYGVDALIVKKVKK